MLITFWDGLKKKIFGEDFKKNLQKRSRFITFVHADIKSAINIKNNLLIFSQPKIYSKPIAKLEKGRLVLIKKCKENWCKVNTDNFLGWVKKENLWGKIR